MHKTYKNLADLLLNCESAQRFYNNLPLHSKLELKEKGSHLQTEDALRSLAKTISESAQTSSPMTSSGVSPM